MNLEENAAVQLGLSGTDQRAPEPDHEWEQRRLAYLNNKPICDLTREESDELTWLLDRRDARKVGEKKDG